MATASPLLQLNRGLMFLGKCSILFRCSAKLSPLNSAWGLDHRPDHLLYPQSLVGFTRAPLALSDWHWSCQSDWLGFCAMNLPTAPGLRAWGQQPVVCMEAGAWFLTDTGCAPHSRTQISGKPVPVLQVSTDRSEFSSKLPGSWALRFLSMR